MSTNEAKRDTDAEPSTNAFPADEAELTDRVTDETGELWSQPIRWTTADGSEYDVLPDMERDADRVIVAEETENGNIGLVYTDGRPYDVVDREQVDLEDSDFAGLVSADETSAENAPDIDYTDPDKVRATSDYEHREAVKEKARELSVGDEVKLNNRSRSLEVIPHDEAYPDLCAEASGVTVFLEGNNTKYRFKVKDHSKFPKLDRGKFSEDEYVVFLSVEGGDDE